MIRFLLYFTLFLLIATISSDNVEVVGQSSHIQSILMNIEGDGNYESQLQNLFQESYQRRLKLDKSHIDYLTPQEQKMVAMYTDWRSRFPNLNTHRAIKKFCVSKRKTGC